MSPIPPLLPSVGLPPSPLQAAVTATVVADLGGALADLPPNGVFEATAQPAPQPGVVALSLPGGPLLVRLPMPLPDGATLRFQVVGGSATPQLRLLAIDGQPLGTPWPAAPATLRGAPPGVAIPPGPLAADTLPPTVNTPPDAANVPRGLAATLVAAKADGPAADWPTGRGALPAGTTFTVRITNLEPPAPPAAAEVPPADSRLNATSMAMAGPPVTASEPGLVPARASPADSPPLPAPPPSPPATDDPIAAPAGADPTAAGVEAPSPATGTVAAALPTSPPVAEPPPGATPTPLAPPLLPDSLTGVVARNTHAGRTLLQTALGLLSLDADLPPGSRVTLAAVGPPTLPVHQAAANEAALPAPPATWPALDGALEVLRQVDAAAVAQVLQRLPELGPRLGPAMLALASAVQAGSLRSWLGERPVKALERAGRHDLVEQLEHDLGDLKTPVRLPTAGEWQSLVLPLPFGPRVERVRVTMRRPAGEDDDEGRAEDGNRFLVDLDMSRLGPLQIDGLVKRKARRFDLIVRSHTALPDDMRRDIGGIFARALEGLGMSGGASFEQAVHFIEPLRQPPPRMPGLVI